MVSFLQTYSTQMGVKTKNENFPSWLGEIKALNLSRLSFSWKNLSYFRGLESLDLSENLLTKVPEEVFQLKNITHLNLSDNEITFIPEEIGELKHLTVLDLTFNPLQKLPKSLANIPGKLSILVDESFPAFSIPPELLNKEGFTLQQNF